MQHNFFILHHIQGALARYFLLMGFFMNPFPSGISDYPIGAIFYFLWKFAKMFETSYLPVVMLTPAVNCSPVLLTQLNNNGCMMAAEQWGKKSLNVPHINLSAAG
jgi:hypothetical protein